jgi:two-component system phosphate regulon response regulator PhoB
MRRVLLIDDTPEIAELLTFALRDRGYDVVGTGFPDDINQLVAEQRPDALVIDCSVFELSESLFDSLRAGSHQQALPVVVISDTPEKADASLRAREAERVLLVPKPFTGSQVARALDELLSPTLQSTAPADSPGPTGSAAP